MLNQVHLASVNLDRMGVYLVEAGATWTFTAAQESVLVYQVQLASASLDRMGVYLLLVAVTVTLTVAHDCALQAAACEYLRLPVFLIGESSSLVIVHALFFLVTPRTLCPFMLCK